MLASPSQTRGTGSIPPWARPLLVVLVAATLLWALSKLFLIVFASILMAIGLCAIARPITKYAGLPHGPAVAIASLAVILAIGWPLSVFGSRVWAQFDEITTDLPLAVASIKQTLEAHASVRFLEQFYANIDFSKLAAPVAAHVSYVISAIGAATAYVTLLLFGALYFALTPDFYVKGLVRFTPENLRARSQQFLARSESSLRMWLSTQLLVVLINGVFAGLGLWMCGVDGAAALAVLAGLLSFIPYLGTIVAMLIAALSALQQGTSFAVSALAVIGAISFLEGYFITPFIQSKALHLPPVVVIFAIFALGILFGTLGIVLAAPLTVVAMIALDTFYDTATVESE